MKLSILVGSLLCFFVFASAVSAQSSSVSGDIRGTITDPELSIASPTLPKLAFAVFASPNFASSIVTSSV
jgi:hypothetical protein